MTRREAILQAVEAALKTTGARVIRNAEIPATAPVEGLIVVRDGDPGEPDVTLSPLVYSFTHHAIIEAYAQSGAKTVRVANLDDLVLAIGAALATDRTFGGLVEFAAPGGVAVIEHGQPGAASIAQATITLTLIYSVSDPLS